MRNTIIFYSFFLVLLSVSSASYAEVNWGDWVKVSCPGGFSFQVHAQQNPAGDFDLAKLNDKTIPAKWTSNDAMALFTDGKIKLNMSIGIVFLNAPGRVIYQNGEQFDVHEKCVVK